MAERELTSILKQPSGSTKSGEMAVLSEGLKLDPKLAREIAEISNHPRTDILADQPAPKDAFGFAALVRILSDIILSESTQTPITICVDGGWGTGKTSILRMLEAQAQMLDFPCIWLNAWSLENTDNMFLAVASEILEAFKVKELPQAKRRLTDSVVDWLAQVAVALGGNVLPGSPSVLRAAVEQMRGTKGVMGVSREREQEIAELASIATSHRSFARLIDTLFEQSRFKDARLIVFIDDLDRALPEQVASILRNLKLILEIPRCVFVMAMDMDTVARSITSHYHQESTSSSSVNLGVVGGESSIEITQSGLGETVQHDFGYHFLEKLIQISVEVPPLTRESAYRYLEEIGVAPEVLEIVKWAPDEEILNPRRLKRYINWLSVSLQLIASVGMPRNVRNVTALRAMALRHDYPEVYALMIDIVSGGQRRTQAPELSTLIHHQAFRTWLEFDHERPIKQFITFSEEELRKASDTLGANYESSENETDELLRQIALRILRIRSFEPLQTHLEEWYQGVVPCMRERHTAQAAFLHLVESDERFADSVRQVVDSQLVRDEIWEFLQYLSKLPARERLAFDRFLRENPILDVGRREYWISRDEMRDRYLAQRIKQIAQASSASAQKKSQ